MLWMYIQCYQLTLDAYLQTIGHGDKPHATPAKGTLPNENDNPVAVYCSKSNRITQVNKTAHNMGIEVNHGLAQAAALCPHIHILPFDAENERVMLSQLAHRLYPFASDIALDAHCGLAIRLDNLTHYYGGHKALWSTLSRELSLSGTTYHFATAWTIEAAKVLAKHKVNTYLDAHDDIKNALSSCSLLLTELAPKVVESLTRVGIKHVHQLLAMPVHELGRRFDNRTITYLTALRGETFPKVILFRPQAYFDDVVLLPFDIENTQHLVPFITQQLEHLSHYLRARNLHTACIHVHIHFREAPITVIDIRAAMPQSSVNSWLSLLTLKIENIVLPEPATALSLKCDQFEDIDTDNSDFFSNRFNEVAQKQLIGRLNAKLGEDSTFQPKAADSHQFEYMTVNETSAPLSTYSSDIAPTLTFKKPKPLTQPTHVCFGPIRLHSEWWHGTPHKRDYFIAQTTQGIRMLIFKDEASQWWAQGLFC
jgi:protein ImuB